MTARMWSRIIGVVGLMAGLLVESASTIAQPAQDSGECRLPGGCGTSGKPGGVERAPGGAMEDRAGDSGSGMRSRAAKKKAKPATKAQKAPSDSKSAK